MSVFDWSQTAADNGDSDASINAAENIVPGLLNNNDRAIMAALAQLRADQGGEITTGGTGNAFTANTASDITAYQDGILLYVVADRANTGASTLNVESLGAKKWLKATVAGVVPLVENDLVAGGHYLTGYDASADSNIGAWILHNPTSVTLADGIITAAKIATDAVGSDEIAAGAVGASEIATDAVGSDEIAANAVGASEIATGAVGSDEIAENAVTESELHATITEYLTGLIPYPEATDYRIVLNIPYDITITQTTTRSTSGTATATFKINTTALGGTANSVSTSEQSQNHSSANVASAGDDVVLTLSSVSSAAGISFTVRYTRVLT